MKRYQVNLKEAPKANPATMIAFLQGLGHWFRDPDTRIQAVIDVPDAKSDALKSLFDRYGIPYVIRQTNG